MVFSGAQVVASGFFSSVGLMDHVTPAQQRKVLSLLAAFGARALAAKSALAMSYGEFRKILLLRALVHEPRLVTCDEPFDGLDAGSKADFTRALERVARDGTRLILVTHHPGDLPRCITHGLLLDKGRIVCQGGLAAVRAHPAMGRLYPEFRPVERA